MPQKPLQDRQTGISRNKAHGSQLLSINMQAVLMDLVQGYLQEKVQQIQSQIQNEMLEKIQEGMLEKIQEEMLVEEIQERERETVVVIGGGWYGCRTALHLANEGYKVTLIEKGNDLFPEGSLSRNGGQRLHFGPHYGRCLPTRINCHEGAAEFKQRHPTLLQQNFVSLYALGTKDTNDQPSKIDEKQFENVTKENSYLAGCDYSKIQINPEQYGLQNVVSAVNLDEPTITSTDEVVKTYKKLLQEAGVNIVYNFEVKELNENEKGVAISNGQQVEEFNYAVNATSYKALTSPDKALPYNMELVYQVVVSFNYKLKNPTGNPTKDRFSFTVIDGWFPCLMPKGNDGLHMLTNGKFSILASCATPAEAEAIRANLTAVRIPANLTPEQVEKFLETTNNQYLQAEIEPRCRKEMIKFWPGSESEQIPGFKDLFEFTGQCVTDVICKPRTKTEYRSAMAIKRANGKIIDIIPGKINDIFQIAREVGELVKSGKNLVQDGDFQFIEHGTLYKAKEVLADKPEKDDLHNTGNLQTLRDLGARNQNEAEKVQIFWIEEKKDKKGELLKLVITPDVNLQPSVRGNQQKKHTGYPVMAQTMTFLLRQFGFNVQNKNKPFKQVSSKMQQAAAKEMSSSLRRSSRLQQLSSKAQKKSTKDGLPLLLSKSLRFYPSYTVKDKGLLPSVPLVVNGYRKGTKR
jgi:hypothetical protein